MLIIGIDPGASGGIAFLYEGRAEAHKIPGTDADIRDLLTAHGQHAGNVFAYIEKVHAMPGNGATSMFNFGSNFGALKMALTCCYIPYEMVTPQKWKKEFGLIFQKKLKMTQTQIKNKDKARAQELFPSIKMTHAIADSLLIAEYGRRTRGDK